MRLFQLLLRLFPRSFRDAFGQEMTETCADQRRAARERGGRAAVARFWLRTIAGMSIAAWRERADQRGHGHRPASFGESLAGDVRFAARMLARTPLFTAVVVVVLSLGVGAVATIFSALNALMLRPLPGTTDGDRLVLIDRRTPDGAEHVNASHNFYRYVLENAGSLDGAAVWSRVAFTLSTGGSGVTVNGNIVSSNYFSVLGVRPAAGRFFVAADDVEPLATPELVLSHAFWVRQFGAAPGIVGSAVQVNGRPYRVVGVAPAGFHGVFTPIQCDGWVPLAMQPHLRPGRDLTDAPWLWMFGRLRDGVTSPQAHAELSTLTRTWAERLDQWKRYSDASVTPLTGLPDDARRAMAGFGAVLLGAAGLVLMIAAANVSSLLAARAVARQREMGVRTALGASRWRLVRQLLTETLALFVLGGIGGTAVAALATAALERLPLPADAALILELSPDGRVLAFALAVSLAAGLGFGLGPAFRSAGDPLSLLRSASAGGGRRLRATRGLIVAQMAASLVLLAAAALFVRALGAGASVEPGFDASHVAVAPFNTESYGYDEARGRAFYAALRRHLETTPGVESVAFSNMVPLTMSDSGGTITVDGGGPGGKERPRIRMQSAVVDAGYFATLGIPVLAGRGFTPADAADGSPVAVVNETFARRAWPDGDAIGRTFDDRGERITVVGIARDAKYAYINEGPTPFVYRPVAQRWSGSQTLFIRTRAGAPTVGAAIESAVAAVDPQLPRPAVSTLVKETGVAVLPQRVAAIVTGTLGIAGLLLASIGLYGLIAHAVHLRAREIGVRMALGARKADVVRLMFSGALRLAAVSVAIGLVGALLGSRLLARYLLTVSPFDPLAFAGASCLFLAIALVASYLPARRAASADPMITLRAE